MRSRLLLSAPLGAPGPMTALRNHKAILGAHYDVDLIPLEHLISPSIIRSDRHKEVLYRLCKRIKSVPSVAKIKSYGDNVIFGTFHPVHVGIVKQLNRLNIRPSFMWCSTLGQMELTPHEMGLFVRLVELLNKGHINHLFLHRRLFDSMHHFVRNAKLLPHSIDLAPYRGVRKLEMPGFHVDLFCRVRPGKNILNQITAFKMAGIDGTLHANFDVRQFSGVVEEIGVNIVHHRWMPTHEYLRLIAGMGLSLQVTVGESFNYAVCERMCLGVPVLSTKDIYLISEDRFLARYLCVDAPDTPSVIARAVRDLARDHDLRSEIAQASEVRIAEVARMNNQVVLKQIRDCFR